MVIEIMSAEMLRKYAISRHAETAAVISITNRDEESLNLAIYLYNGIRNLIHMRFNDAEAGMTGCITDDDGEVIALFVNEVAGKSDKLIIQCGYGISRSAGVAAAIMKHLTGSDVDIWNNPKYRPNITCYRKVMAALNQAFDEQELNEKIAANRSLAEMEVLKADERI